jgi:hypothetical protein
LELIESELARLDSLLIWIVVVRDGFKLLIFDYYLLLAIILIHTFRERGTIVSALNLSLHFESSVACVRSWLALARNENTRVGRHASLRYILGSSVI